ncbi:hypothetical protein ES288_D07G172600v1 [Gossypium darwinii]|uniref:Uncharacterized protein n=2 Tax=Gossypium TaxID=3633 RepID=A0A5D2K7P9_GOSTO|nr:hypothetical protein ES288_D07G172600v1 [Gossypium darwinii]TYH63151.1 hypothetical protein ES332_D07G170100v1 [Gossypium tomentosum]
MQTCWLDKNPSFLFMQVKFSGYSPTKICFAINKVQNLQERTFEQLNSLNYIQDKSNYDTVIKLKSDKAREVIPVKQTEFYTGSITFCLLQPVFRVL